MSLPFGADPGVMDPAGAESFGAQGFPSAPMDSFADQGLGISNAFGNEGFGSGDAFPGWGDGAGGSSQCSTPQVTSAWAVPTNTSDELFQPLPEEQGRQLARAFEQACNADGFVAADEGRHKLQLTGLDDQVLQNIWNLSDLDRDGRLSLREFVCAMHLAENVKQGQQLPAEVRPEQQERLARGLQRHLLGSSSAAADAFGASTSGTARGRPKYQEDFSTVDTAASDLRAHKSGKSRKKHGGEPHDAARDFALDSEFSTVTSRVQDSGVVGVVDRPALGQLASVLEAVARLDAGGELRRLSNEVLDERRELERQLSHRRTCEKQLRESRGQLDVLNEERRRVEGESLAAQRRIAHLQDELGFVEREVRAAEEDLRVLREASGLGEDEGAFAGLRRGPAPYSSAEEERHDVLSKVRAERELLQRDQRSIEELRARLDDILKQKSDAQLLQQSLLEKQRQAEQDRGLMLTAIEAERGKLGAIRADRIKLWEERSALEKELMDISQESFLVEQSAPVRSNRGEQTRSYGMPNPTAFQTAPADVQRRRGVPQEAQPPPVVFAGPPEERRAGGHGGFGFGGLRRPTSDGLSASAGYPSTSGGGAAHRMDNRGVRNEAPAANSTGWNDGFGTRSLRSQTTADFGSN